MEDSDDNAGGTVDTNLGKRRLLALAAVAVVLTASFYFFLLAVMLAVAALLVFAISQGSGWAMAVALPLGLLIAVTRRSIAAAIPRRRSRELTGVEISGAAQPDVWSLVDPSQRYDVIFHDAYIPGQRLFVCVVFGLARV